MLDIAIAKPALPKSGALVLLLDEGATADSPAGALWKEADAATGGAITRALTVADFKGKKGQSTTILAPGAGLSRVLAIGLGKSADLTPHSLEEAGGHITPALAKEPNAGVSTAGLTPIQAASVAMGAALRAYRFDRYRTKEKPEDKPKLAKLTVLTTEVPKAKTAWEPLAATANGVCLSRDLVSEPPNVLNPAELAER